MIFQVIALQYNCFLVACAFPHEGDTWRRLMDFWTGIFFAVEPATVTQNFQLVTERDMTGQAEVAANKRATRLSRDSSYLSFFRPRVVPRHARLHRATALLRTAARSGTANDERGALPMRVLCLCARVLVRSGRVRGT